jgi:hypothetical protein
VWNQLSGSSAVPKRTRRTSTVTKKYNQCDSIKGDTSQVHEERVHVTMSGAHTSNIKRKSTQVEETHKKKKYTTKDPVMSLT